MEDNLGYDFNGLFECNQLFSSRLSYFGNPKRHIFSISATFWFYPFLKECDRWLEVYQQLVS